MTVPNFLISYANAHIAKAIRDMPNYATLLPGGVHRNVGPEGIPHPFAVVAFAGGADKNAFAAGVIGGGLLFQIKVIGLGLNEIPSVTAYVAISEALIAANNSSVSGAYVSGQEENPIDAMVTERDQTFQQLGGNWRFWIDPIAN